MGAVTTIRKTAAEVFRNRNTSEVLPQTDELHALCEACAALGNKNCAKRHLAAGFIPAESAVPQT